MNVIHIWIYCLNIDLYYSYQMHTHPEQMKQREKHTKVPPKTFFFFSPKGEIKAEKSEENFKYNEHWGEKSIGQIVSTKIRTKKLNSIPIWNKIPSYTLPCLSDQWLKSFLQAFKTGQRTKEERPGVRGSHGLLPGLVCISPSGIFPVLLAVRWGSVMADAAQGSCLM